MFVVYQAQMFVLMTNMLTVMQQQQQQFFQLFAPQAQAAVVPPQVRPVQARELRLPEFTKLAPQFTGQSPDPMVAENWVNEVEKTFKAFEVPEASKLSLAEFQLKERANDWWVAKKASMGEEVGWTGFKVLFYEKYFPESTKDKMLGQLLTLQ